MLKKQVIFEVMIILIIILFLGFFSYTLLSDKVSIVHYGTGILLMITTFIGLLFKDGIKLYKIDKLVLVFIFGIILSSFIAYVYWTQTFYSSLKCYAYFYIYFLYFILLFFNTPSASVERIILILFFLSLIIFLLDYISIPNPLFAYRTEERRNGITIFFYGQGFTFLGAFYFLNKFFTTKRVYQLLLFLISAGCLYFLTQSRMNLLAIILGFFLLLLFSNFSKKYLIAMVLVIGGVFFYFTSTLFKGIKEESNDQAQFYKEDVRVLSHKYFLTELQAGLPTVLFGNGVPSSDSFLGSETRKGIELGFWKADVGLTGIFSYFGILGVLVWLLFFYTVFKMKNRPQFLYLKAYFLTLLTTAFTGYSIFDPGYMPATILALYLVRCEININPSLE